MNWDNLKVFLVLAKESTLQATAKSLSINVSTVMRRLNNLEDSLGSKLLYRNSNHYVLTGFGKDVLRDTQSLENLANNIERMASFRNITESGCVRLAIPECIAVYLLSNELREFSISYPEIKVELITNVDEVDICKGEADIALQFTNSPSEELVGRKLTRICFGAYVSKRSMLESDSTTSDWIGCRELESKLDNIANLNIKWNIDNLLLRHAACRENLGITLLPCFIGDADSELFKIPGNNYQSNRETWLLVHPVLRNTRLVRVVLDLLINTFESSKDLIEGQRIC